MVFLVQDMEKAENVLQNQDWKCAYYVILADPSHPVPGW